eukprot:403333459
MQNLQRSLSNNNLNPKTHNNQDDDQSQFEKTDAGLTQAEKASVFDSTGDNSQNSQKTTNENYIPQHISIRKPTFTQQNQTRQNGIVSGIMSILCGCCETTNSREIQEQELLMNSNLIPLHKIDGKSPPYSIGQKRNREIYGLSPNPSGINNTGGESSKVQLASQLLNKKLQTDDAFLNNQQAKKSDSKQESYYSQTNILSKALEGLEENLTDRKFRDESLNLETLYTMYEWQQRIESQMILKRKQEQQIYGKINNNENSQQQLLKNELSTNEHTDIDSLYVTRKHRKNVNEWTINDDDKLLTAYSQFKSNWPRVSLFIGTGKDAQQCRKRYQYLKSKNVIDLLTSSSISHKHQKSQQTSVIGKECKNLNQSDQWDSQTDSKIIELVKKLGYNWKQIANFIKGKNARQIGDRFHNVLKVKLSEPKEFSTIEDKKLLETYELYPNNWKEILKQLPGRNTAMIKERYHVIKEQQLSSDLAFLYKRGKTTRSEDFDASQSTRIRTSTDIETKDGTFTNNDGQLYGSWDHLDENDASINDNSNNNVNFLLDYGNNTQTVQNNDSNSSTQLERKESKNHKNITPTVQTISIRFSPVISTRFNRDDSRTMSMGSVTPFEPQVKTLQKQKYYAKLQQSGSLGSEQQKLFLNPNANEYDFVMKQSSSSGLSNSHSFIQNFNENMSQTQSQVWRRGSLFSQGQQSSKHSMASMMNKELHSSGVSHFYNARMSTLQEEDIKSISTHLERLSIGGRSNISMANDFESQQ